MHDPPGSLGLNVDMFDMKCWAVQSVRCELLPCHRQTGAGQGTGAAQPGPELASTPLERSIAHLLPPPHTEK